MTQKLFVCIYSYHRKCIPPFLDTSPLPHHLTGKILFRPQKRQQGHLAAGVVYHQSEKKNDNESD